MRRASGNPDPGACGTYKGGLGTGGSNHGTCCGGAWIFLSEVKVNEWVKEGQSLEQMVDLLWNPLSDVTAPSDGLILFVVTSSAVKKGGLLLGIGVPE